MLNGITRYGKEMAATERSSSESEVCASVRRAVGSTCFGKSAPSLTRPIPDLPLSTRGSPDVGAGTRRPSPPTAADATMTVAKVIDSLEVAVARTDPIAIPERYVRPISTHLPRLSARHLLVLT